MAFDFSKIKAKKKESGLIDPIEIFQKNKSKIRDAGINDLWLGQGDALRDWHEHRNNEDVAIVLNTGAGKTLIGLLVAQSLVNETKGKVMYACASIQLIEQTREKADGYGIKVTTYYGGEFSNDLFHKGEAVCLTTYQALFNGKSKFRDEEISALIFDDAHTAEGMIKDHFSLALNRNDNENLFSSLLNILRPYYQSIGKSGTFDGLLSGEHNKVELAPPFEIMRNISEITRLLIDAGVSNNKNTMFAWMHMKDHLDLCAYFISGKSIQIIPPVIPIMSLPYFQKGIRRVYLSATMLSSDSFIRTFGRELDYVVEPDTPAGQCERLIVFPQQVYGVVNDYEISKNFIKNRKTLILAPNYFLAKKWEDIGKIPEKDNIVADLRNFKASISPDKLILAARYDGIDLPGDTCRHLIMDGLPTGTGLSDKYLWESLRLSNILRSTLACRIVQSLGRISRGMSDHGVVLILGDEYVKWLLTPKNQAYLPAFVQKQIKLGLHVSESFDSPNDIVSVADSCLNRKEEWIGAYEQFMDDCEIEEIKASDDELKNMAIAESNFIKKYWNRDYVEAIKILEKKLNDTFAYSVGLGSWYALWIGYCFELSGDASNAVCFYKRAHGNSRNIPKHIYDEISQLENSVPEQIENVSNGFLIGKGSSISVPKTFYQDLGVLNGAGTFKQTEEALRCLGQYLGLDSTRPDNEHGTGPDVLWINANVALVIEAKTEKEASYKKEDVGQLSDHMQWVDDHYQVNEKIPLFVGPLVSATKTANPSDKVMVVELSEFKKLGDILISAYEDIVGRAMPLTLTKVVDDVFNERHLKWPDLLNSLVKHQLNSLQRK
ncbi:MAG: DEAD/DEAH box helicase family protein [Gammaproteobacteria bacterium]|nr:DEAD/DEAH box helicase family protein [Gammaproteobacteria bacterium]MBU1724837.1 DEAD/DEAH box helicase family protein [Gammaproteobacteria bacterium]MBU2006500.1 DEAD/DEAH box helicase family protein [Gammaproteobacteria bacterium]